MEHYDDVFKIIVIGDAGVGKTNLIETYAKERPPKNINPTVGVEYTSKMVNLRGNRKAKAQIWDTAGQEQYRSIAMGHYKKSLGALVVFDVNNRKSFDNLQQWVETIRQRADEYVQIGIIGHKIDLNRRKVTKDQGQKMASNLRAFYLQTTIQDCSSINNVFQRICEDIDRVKKQHNPEFQNNGIRLGEGSNDNNDNCKC